MENSISAFKVTLLLWISLSIHLVEPAIIRGQLSDMSVVSDIVRYVQPYIQSLQVGPAGIVYKKTEPPNTPEAAIDQKIKELALHLQDNDVSEKIELEGADEITIVEFRPKGRHILRNILNDTVQQNETEPFHKNLKQFRNLRNKIKLALERESVSNKTKKIVTRTLDELIAKLIQRQCPEFVFQNNLRKLSRFRPKLFEDIVPKLRYDSNNNCYVNEVKLKDEECRSLKEPFKHCKLYGKDVSEEECRKLMQFAMTNKPCYIGDKKFKAETCKKLAKNITDSINMTTDSFMKYIKTLFPLKDKQIFDFYNMFTETISNVLQYPNKVPENYKVKCTLVDTDKEKKRNILRSKDVCKVFRVCSEELREFLKVFYKSLNDTAVRAFNNYAAMYEKDIIDESEEKNTVLSNIKYASKILEGRVSNVFIKTTGQIVLDENKDRDMNVAALREYVKHTIKAVNKTVSKHLDNDLGTLRVKLLSAIKQDLIHNLAEDLGHLQTDVIKEICSFFVTCKGDSALSKNLARKFAGGKAKSNSVFVNMQLALDDDLKDTILKNHNAIRQGTFKETLVKNQKAVTQGTSYKPIILRSQFEPNHNIDVNFKETLMKNHTATTQDKTKSYITSKRSLYNTNISPSRTTLVSEITKPTLTTNLLMSMENSDSYDESDTNSLHLNKK